MDSTLRLGCVRLARNNLPSVSSTLKELWSSYYNALLRDHNKLVRFDQLRDEQAKTLCPSGVMAGGGGTSRKQITSHCKYITPRVGELE